MDARRGAFDEKMRKELLKLIEYRKKASSRRSDGVFLAEGEKLFLECDPARILSVAVTEAIGKASPETAGKIKALTERNVKILTVTENEFERVSDTKTPQGVLAVVRAYDYSEEELFRDPSGLYVFLDSVQDPGNVGTIIRSAEAAGVSGVVLNRTSADVYNPKVIRSTMGSVFRMKFLTTDDLPGLIKRFRSGGGRVFSACLPGSVPYDAPDYRGKSAFLVGNESRGLSEEVIALSDERIRIPMEGRVESLNAAMAATILMYEAHRQRSGQ